MPKSQRTQKVAAELKDNSHLDKDVLFEIAEDADQYHALKVLLDQEGGSLLVDNLLADVLASVEQLAGSYQTLTLQQFIGFSARISSSLGTARSITRAAENLKGADELLTERLRE